jgi:universal stress protein E
MTDDSKQILVVIDSDRTEDQLVIERAAWFAERFGARVELFECVFDRDIDVGRFEHVWTPEPGAREQLLAQHRRHLDALAAPLRARGLRVGVHASWTADSVDAVLRKVALDQPWLVVKGTEHRSYIRRTFLTSADWELVRDCPAPLLLVKERQLSARPQVLAAVDPTHAFEKPAALDDKIVAFAGAVAKAASGDLHVVHAYSMPPSLYGTPLARDLILDEHRAQMGRFLARHAIASEHAHLFEGLPHECLQQAADDYGADFLVMGAVSRYGVERWIIGSTARRMLDRVACDLIIIKPDRLVVPAATAESEPGKGDAPPKQAAAG